MDLVTSADLKSLESVATPPPGAPAPTAVPQPPQPEPKPEPPQPEPEPQPAPEPQPKAAEPAPVTPPIEEKPKEQTPEQKDPAKEKEQAALPDFESLLPDLATMPQPTEEVQKPPEQTKAAEKATEAPRPAEKKEAPKKKSPQKQARVEPTPQDLSSAPPGRSAGATRPPGITRSGENDDFGRGVIHALRTTMPPPRGIYGRVTIRIILNENGDIAQLQLLDASGTSLDQSVMFAAKQSYFPLPPYNSTLADRTFTITYVYR
ncbi:TonB family protein [Hyphomicrobium sp.]|uniref:TonB family protein n=1 Tax=Hyphomicrobium sp. TaxID=82 RepID=UPI002E30013B|nr:TonB family protein [Hyphomicrobium sp.]HEX2843506.1 TonB family protein [Hyphomicrobium sp.]